MVSDSRALVTPLLITYNEEVNIARTLESLQWANRIVVVDSGSTDSTLQLLARLPQVEIVHRPFDTFASQCNYGLTLIDTPWCLSLDADHVVTSSFVSEMHQVLQTLHPDVDAILTSFRYLVSGRPLRGALLPPRFNLVRIGGGCYVDDGHAHRFVPKGSTLALRHPILHDDRKPLARWLNAQQRYLEQECDKLLNQPFSALSFADRLRLLHVVAPFAVLTVCLILRGGLLDGWRGWFYAFQRLYVEVLLSLMLWERRRMCSAPCTTDGSIIPGRPQPSSSL